MNHLVVYLKAPAAGTVKTRLQTRYTPEQAADLYRAFILDTFDTAATIDVDCRIASYAGDRTLVADIVPEGWSIVEQIDADLGTRMRQSLQREIDAGADKVVLIGTDLPSLPAHHLADAFHALDTSDVVVGPTTDGGFYLIGTRIDLPDIFPGVTWSSEHVFEQTTAGIERAGLRMGTIPLWSDIDTPEDLDDILEKHQAPLTHTRAVLASFDR